MKLKFKKKINEARGTKSFFWEPEKSVYFLPGQFFYFTLPKLNYPDPRGSTRHFTIASSPTEKKLLMITTRIRDESGYKKTLDELEIGAEIEGEGPNGTLILDEKTNQPLNQSLSHIFLAGGIGITPFRSFIKNNIDKNLKIPMYLIYSNSDSDFVFKKELDTWQKQNDFINIVYFNTSVSGHLNELEIRKFIENWKLKIGNSVFWTVGPPAFTDAIEDALEQLDISSDKILTEKFTGY